MSNSFASSHCCYDQSQIVGPGPSPLELVVHSNVVSVIGSFREAEQHFVVMEHCEKGSLSALLRGVDEAFAKWMQGVDDVHTPTTLPEPETELKTNSIVESETTEVKQTADKLTLLRKWSILLDIATALEYLHSVHKPPIVHGDVKSANCLVTKAWRAKIAMPAHVPSTLAYFVNFSCAHHVVL